MNHKKAERIYAEEELSLRRKRKRRIRSEARERPASPKRPNKRWAIDFMSDCIAGGRRFRALTVIDEFTRECLAIRVDRRLNSTSVIDVLSDLFILRGVPEFIRSDNGPETKP